MNEITTEPVATATSLVTVQSSLLNFVASAVTNPDVQVDKLETLLRIQREILAEEALNAYARAMAEVQHEMQPVVRDAHNDQTRSDYATLAKIAKALQPIYSKRGFSLEFNTEPSQHSGVCMVCECSHAVPGADGERRLSHRKWFRLEADLDTAGAQGKVNKTPMHGLGSTLSYLRRYMTCMIFNVSLMDDDDGNAGGGTLRRNNTRRSDDPPPPPRKKLKDFIADLIVRFSEAPDRAAIEAIIAEHETQTVLANITQEPGRSTLAECIANGRARFPIAKDAERPAFAAYVIDAFGEIVSEEIHDPVRFAHAVVDAWRNAPAPSRNNVIEHNADAIEDARQFGSAALVLLDMKPVAEDQASDKRDPRDETPSYTPAVVEPPIERGKPFWPRWVQRFKAALDDVPLPFDNLEAWVQAQRETLTRAPMAQRLLAIRAVDTAFAPHDMPTWLADLVKADPLPSNGSTPPPTDGAAEPTRDRRAWGVSQEADEHWVEDRISDLVLIESRAAFNRIVDDAAVRNRMNRLRRERPLLFEKADAAFGVAHRRLPPAEA